MLSDADIIADRRRMRRKLTFWRVLSILILVLGLVSAGMFIGRNSLDGSYKNHIARISVSGLIVGSEQMEKLIKQVSASSSVKAVIVSIDSPGGTTTGSEKLYRSLRALAAKKPVVAFVDGNAASGAYITAIATDHIVARETSIVGSIGVIMQYPNVAGLLDKVGVKFEEVKSSPLKAEPSGYKPTSPEAREAMQKIIADSFTWFKGLVADRRGLKETELATVADGRIFTGRQGLPLKLVDELGDERTAVAWLETQKGIEKGLSIREWKPKSYENLSFLSTLAYGADLLGYEKVADNFRRAGEKAAASNLDGLLALWQPSLNN
ncbi:signal peptide peptidase SppA [Microvirga sp. W0021]|uniref:Signal peptide peptidase SppA n=1 Tax=Hohaiivirga grylli TaxID=3133970 RepID=A0ABV0BGJ7_9HYPH